MDKNGAFTSNAAAVSLTRRFPIITVHRLERYLKLKNKIPKLGSNLFGQLFFNFFNLFFFYSEAVFELTFGGFLCLLPLLRRHVLLYFTFFFLLALWLFILVGTRITGMAGILEVLEGRGRKQQNRST